MEAWRSAAVPVVAVTNEVGSGAVPGTRSVAPFRDALGRLNQRLAGEPKTSGWWWPAGSNDWEGAA